LSRKDDDQVKRLERAREIGLFRYMLIREAADASLTGRQRGALVRAIAAVPHTDPDGRTVRITRWTLDRWILDWRKAGFDALVPSPRQSAPRTPPEIFELATALKKENPDRSAAQVKRIVEAQHGWAPDERTLQRMFVRTGLTALRGPGRAGGVRPVRGRAAQRLVDRGRPARPEDQRPQNLPFRLHRRPQPRHRRAPVGVR
jgi:putative transposase